MNLVNIICVFVLIAFYVCIAILVQTHRTGILEVMDCGEEGIYMNLHLHNGDLQKIQKKRFIILDVKNTKFTEVNNNAKN